jgi:hypothetical protein
MKINKNFNYLIIIGKLKFDIAFPLRGRWCVAPDEVPG